MTSAKRSFKTATSVQDFTIGDLIGAWGMPTGIVKYGRALDVYWETHYASLNICSFQPDSRVKTYRLFSRSDNLATAWRGFSSTNVGECQGMSQMP